MTAQERKEHSEQYLRSAGIPVNEGLPLIEAESEAHIRDGQEIAKRILILTYLNVATDKGSRSKIADYLKTADLWEAASENEQELFLKDEWTERDVIDVSWLTECIYLMLWAIGKVNTLGLPTTQCDSNIILESLPPFFGPNNSFIETAVCRDTEEILNMSDLLYRLHWAARQAQLDGQKMPAGIDAGIVEERHYAINWITFYDDNWDDVGTDT